MDIPRKTETPARFDLSIKAQRVVVAHATASDAKKARVVVVTLS